MIKDHYNDHETRERMFNAAPSLPKLLNFTRFPPLQILTGLFRFLL